MLKAVFIVAICMSLAACSSTRQCPTGQTAVGLVDGVLVYTPVMGACAPSVFVGPNTSGIFAEGPMPAPSAGDEWWNAFN